ncbi:MAG: tRNA/rRNA methyltransferase [Gammaproteobacteria bacterium HGW-Gammaproteobacteria-14]|nr:MAG: tRNA/rRNA methyltransferase [Gammaproteobacteria bacterium HGW-Gammaproteobacteria-14]
MTSTPTPISASATTELVFILVEPARGENVGAAARALKTMGFSSLWLVNPCDLSGAARWVAHESTDILDQARLFPSLQDALAEVEFSIACSARRRLDKDDYLSPAECRQAIANKSRSVRRAALVFGRESSGLTGEELAACDAATRVPLACEQPSLNLAQAVMLYAWELSVLNTESASAAATDTALATFAHVRQALEEALQRLGVNKQENLQRWAQEGLGRFSDRDLGMLMTLLKRLP